MKSKLSIICFLLVLSGTVFAQNGSSKDDSPNSKMGQKALMDGDFKTAASYFEKALADDANNPNILYTLGYSYYHAGEYDKAVNNFTKVISLRPGEVSAYYYRAKARNTMAAKANSKLSGDDRDRLLQASLRDYTKAIELKSSDMSYYQNRAIAYRDYGILKSQKGTKIYNKAAAASAYRSCMADLQKVLENNPGRKDINDQMKMARVYLQNLDN